MKDFLAHPHRSNTPRLHLASLILLDSYPSTHLIGSISSITTPQWFDTLNSHLLYPIVLTKAFLPLLFAQAPPPINPTPASIVLLSSSTIPSLHAPDHAPESLTTTGITSFFTTLRTELPASISMTHIRLGSLYPRNASFPASETSLIRAARLSRYTPASSSSSSPSRSLDGKAGPIHKSTALRELHNQVFDAAVGRSTGTVYVGRGARIYAIIGAVAPRSLVQWMVKSNGMRGEAWNVSSKRERNESDGGNGNHTGSGSVEWEKVDEP